MNIRKIIYKLLGKSHLSSSEAYIDYLRGKGVKIGNGCYAIKPSETSIDVSRSELLEIGDNVFLHKGLNIQTHDWASWVFVNKYGDFVPSHGKIKIGNNVWFGENVTVLKGTEIGDNVIIGANSIVTRNIPSDCVAVGTPARVICTIDEYYAKRKRIYPEEAIEYALSIYESGRKPELEDFKDDYPVFVDGDNYQDYDFPYSTIFNDESFEMWKKNHRAVYRGFDEFMKAVDQKRGEIK